MRHDAGKSRSVRAKKSKKLPRLRECCKCCEHWWSPDGTREIALDGQCDRHKCTIPKGGWCGLFKSI